MGTTNKLLLRGHGGPATLTLILDGTLGNTIAKVGSDDGTRGLHVEEVGGERALRCIGIVLALLALLLLLNDSRRWGRGSNHIHGHGGCRGLDIEHVLQVVWWAKFAAIEKGGLAQE